MMGRAFAPMASAIAITLCLGSAGGAAPSKPAADGPSPQWRIIETKYPTDDRVAAGFSVGDFGAAADGATDATAAFQQALDAMAAAGGGTVFVPEGRYAVKGYLTVPTGVLLRGEWAAPSPVKGTVLMAYAGRGSADGAPFLLLEITPYPPCIAQKSAWHADDSIAVENVTFVNPYQGVVTGPGNNGRHLLRNVYGSPLATALKFERCTAIGRVEGADFNPDHWSDSGLPGSPARNGAHAAWMRQHGTGLRIYRSDWEYVSFLNIQGYKTGFEKLNSKYGPGTGQLYGSSFSHCGVALSVEYSGPNGFRFTECTFDGEDYGIVTQDPLEEILAFHTCAIRGALKAALLKSQPRSTIVFQNCAFNGEVERDGGNLSLVGCALRGAGNHVTLTQNVGAAAIAGCSFDGPPRIQNASSSSQIQISQNAAPNSMMPKFPKPAARVLKTAKAALYVATAPEWGAKGDGVADDTGAIQKALNAAGGAGGGIVFLPGGTYALRGNLTVPSGVEFRGSLDLPHDTFVTNGCALNVYAGKGREDAAPAMALQAKSGVRGVTFAYPEQNEDAIAPYPFAIAGQGEDVYVVNVTAINPCKVADFMTHRCDRHYLDGVRGNPRRLGVAVGGGSLDGEMRDVHFKPGSKNFASYEAALEAFTLGDCRDELIYQNMVFGTRVGYHFVGENGKGASGLAFGAGTDGTSQAIVCDSLGQDGFDFINAGIDIFYHSKSAQRSDKGFIFIGRQCNSQVRFYNTFFGGTPNVSTLLGSGSVLFETVNFRRFAPFAVHSGAVSFINSYLGEDRTGGKPFFNTEPSGRVQLFATYTPSAFAATPSSPAGSVLEECRVRYAAVGKPSQ
ncbi:MAG: glycosyl hydrolase family 28-related protein [Candidatus Sumerlaeota bacterium]|nr:glycosyl hydrolase family 28-related protein [Candidatus Sumerlaeota bacterium]